MNRRVVVTGIGVVTSLGTNVKDFWEACLRGESVVQPIPEQWSSYSSYTSRVWSPLPTLDFRERNILAVEERQLDLSALIALMAAHEAIRSAGFHQEITETKGDLRRLREVADHRAGTFIGTGVGGVSSLIDSLSHQIVAESTRNLDLLLAEDQHLRDSIGEFRATLKFPRRFHPLSVSMTMPNSSASTIARKFGLRGPARTACSACAAGTVALGSAYRSISAGEIDVALAGGTENLDDEFGGIFRGFDIVGALAQNCEPADAANRPFDKQRSGFLFSQGGSAMLVLEELEHARARGAEPLAEIVGFAETVDAYNPMLPDPSGRSILNMFENLVESSDISYDEIDYLNAHGSGTPANDDIESEIIERVFPQRTLVNSTKSLLGHTIGASGAIEAVVTVLSLLHQTTHISKNLEQPVRHLRFVTEQRDYDIERALSYSFAFGGHNAVIALQRYS